MEQLLQLLELKAEKRCSEKLSANVPTPRKLGNPAVVGLAGFALTTFLLQCHNFGWIKVGPILWMGFFYGGMSQLVAGLLEYGNGNNFGFSAFTTYGAFWISFASTVVANEYTKFTVDDITLGFFLAAFGIYTFVMFIGSLRHNLALSVVFSTLTAGFVLLAVAHLVPDSPGQWPKMAGASVLTVCAAGALYIMAHLVLLESYGRDILPVGQPLIGGRRGHGQILETKPGNCVEPVMDIKHTADGVTLINKP